MKKILTLMLVLACCAGVTPAAQTQPVQSQTQQQHRPDFKQNRPSRQEVQQKFEQRLNLTEKQKAQAKKLNEKGKAQMEPIMKKMKAKHQEMQALKNSSLTDEEKTQQMEKLRTEVQALDKQAREIRKKNSESFEKILTKEQKTEFEKMKAEGRARFEKTHHARPPFQGIGAPVIKPGFKAPKVSE